MSPERRGCTMAPRAPRAPVQVVAVTGGKGGVGKSTVAVNLATRLAADGRATLLFDGDLSLANVDVMLGLTPRWSLAHVLAGERTLQEVLLEARTKLRIVPASSGVAKLAALGPAEHAGLISAFSEIAPGVEVLIVDTAPGLAPSVLQLARAVQNVLVVVCDEPTSLTDAYALIKVLSRQHGVQRFRVLANMVRDAVGGRRLYDTLERVTARFLDVTLEYAGEVPDDPWLRRSIREQRPVVEAYPSSPSARALGELAQRLPSWPIASSATGQIEFFVERLVTPVRPPRLEVVR